VRCDEKYIHIFVPPYTIAFALSHVYF